MCAKKYEVNPEPPSENGGCFGVRHTQTLLLFLGMAIAFSMRVNLSMAIVDMTAGSDRYQWSSSTTSLLHSGFFFGYVILQIPGGELARVVGGKSLITIAVSFNAVISLIMPVAVAYGDWIAVFICRVLQGLFQAFVYPSIHHLISQWVPLNEKALLATIIYSGGQLGLALQLMLSGYIAHAFSWKGIFYCNAAIGAIWTVIYLILGADSPASSKRISQEELMYIQKSLDQVGGHKRRRTPWCSIMSSLPFWAVIVAHCGQNWGFFTLMTQLPTYMANILKFNLRTNGILSSLPYLSMYILSLPIGALSDWFIEKNWIAVTRCRKLCNTIGQWGPAVALLGLALVPNMSTTCAVVMLVTSVGINAGIYSGFMLVHIDMAPNFSASLMGVTNFLANIISIIAPIACGLIAPDVRDPLQWQIVFLVSAGVYFFANLFFIVFSTSEKQAWNEQDEIDMNMSSVTIEADEDREKCDVIKGENSM